MAHGEQIAFRLMRCAKIAVLLLHGMACVAVAEAQDLVHLTVGSDSTTQTTVTGEILDNTGRELTLRLPSGQEQRYARERIVEVETHRSTEHSAALTYMQQHEYAAALAQLESAYGVEDRVWMRREILALRVRCRYELGQFGLAGDEFLVLVRSDPTTQYFDCIPLSWSPLPATVDLQNKARDWLARRDVPAAVLLGAGLLVSLGQGSEAIDALRGLTLQNDPRIVALATSQGWRLRAMDASDRELEQWLKQTESMPPEIRGGPYFLLGQMLAQRQDWQRSALLLLRFSLLYPYPRALAARALGEAADALAHLGQSEEATRLQDELIREYSRSPLAAEILRQRGRPPRGSSDGKN